jgi:hypothetical protein
MKQEASRDLILSAITSARSPSNEQGRGRNHNPRNERGQTGEQQKIVQDYGHGSLPVRAMGVIPRAQRTPVPWRKSDVVELGVREFLTGSLGPTPPIG